MSHLKHQFYLQNRHQICLPHINICHTAIKTCHINIRSWKLLLFYEGREKRRTDSYESNIFSYTLRLKFRNTRTTPFYSCPIFIMPLKITVRCIYMRNNYDTYKANQRKKVRKQCIRMLIIYFIAMLPS